MTDTPPPDDPYATPAPGSPAPPPPPGPPAYEGASYAGYGYTQPVAARNGLGTAALVLGIIALLLSWTIVVGFICGVLALVFGIIGRRRASAREATNGGSALAGAITGGLGLLVSIALIIAGAAFFETHKNDINNYRDCLRQAQTGQERQQCADDFNRSING
jgi:glucose uptake protein GlcU